MVLLYSTLVIQYVLHLFDKKEQIKLTKISNYLGWYWIDPNSGMADDAIFVHCNLTAAGETCIYPDLQSRRMPNIQWRKESEKGDWFSNLRGGFKVQYNIIFIMITTFILYLLT